MNTIYMIKDLDWEKDEDGDLFAKTPFVEYQISTDVFDEGYDLIVSTPLATSRFVKSQYFESKSSAQLGAAVHLYGLLSPIMTDVSEYIEWL